MRHIVVVFGEVGRAIYTVLYAKDYQVEKRDINDDVGGTFDVLHVCFPYFDNFVKEVKKYQKDYTYDNSGL